MPFLLLLILMLVCICQWPTPPWATEEVTAPQVARASLASWAVIAGFVFLAFLASFRARFELRRRPFQRDRTLTVYLACRAWLSAGLFLAYGVVMYVCGWGWLVQNRLWASNGIAWPGAELLLLAPLFAGTVASRACYYDAERAIQMSGPGLFALRRFWGRWSYVAFHIRHNLAMVLVPVGVLIVLQGLQRQFADLAESEAFKVAAYGLVLTLFLCLPLVLRVLLRLRPLPAGPLRERLLAEATRLRFRFSDILVWDTGQGVANAMVVGFAPWLRYVIFTDRLLTEMTPDEVGAVFGHEAGHIKHGHMPFYLGFLITSMAALAGTWQLVATTVQGVPSQPVEGPLVLGTLGLYVFLVFGFLSRRCERQADLYGCRAISCDQADCACRKGEAKATLCPTGILTFIGALEKAGSLNGLSRRKPGWLQSWLHGTIANRVDFLQAVLADPGLALRFQRRVGIVKWLLMLCVLMLLGIVTWSVDRQSGVPSPSGDAWSGLFDWVVPSGSGAR
jgi:Zn-dependent protease with chaperone function